MGDVSKKLLVTNYKKVSEFESFYTGGRIIPVNSDKSVCLRGEDVAILSTNVKHEEIFDNANPENNTPASSSTEIAVLESNGDAVLTFSVNWRMRALLLPIDQHF